MVVQYGNESKLMFLFLTRTLRYRALMYHAHPLDSTSKGLEQHMLISY